MIQTGTARLRGYLDALTSSGYFEGWALDDGRPLRALPVAVRRDGEVIARGVAHRFRRDLMESGCGTGWCAFRLRALVPAGDLPHTVLTLVAADSGAELHVNPTISCIQDEEKAVDSVESVCALDPTVLAGVWQLRACERLLMGFVRRHGVDQFVRTAYIYVLGRPADDGGLAQYGRAIRLTSLSPVGVLEALADSDEFRAQARPLAAPNVLGFPFAA